MFELPTCGRLLIRKNCTTLLAGCAALVFANPAGATSCDERAIAARTIDETARSIWEHSDVIGFGVIESVNTPEREQQFIDMVVTLKGPSNERLAYAPLRIGRIGRRGPGLYRQDPGRDGVAFLAMVRTENGYVVPACQELELAKDRAGIIRRLVAMAGRGE